MENWSDQLDGSLDQRTRRVFGSTWRDRERAPRARLGGQLPDFLAEYLIGLYGVPAASQLVEEHFPTTRNRQLLKYQLLQEGEVELLDYLEVTVDVESGKASAHLTAFQHTFPIEPEILDEHRDVLSGGLWGRVTIRTRAEPKEREEVPVAWPDRWAEPEPILPAQESAWDIDTLPRVTEFYPYQASVDVRSFVHARRVFSTEEWIDLILASAGYNPAWIRGQPAGRRLTRLYLMRLLPLVERNLNLLELGPKNTGKTHLLRNLSPYAFTVSGGGATPANLFVNLATGRPGLVQSRRVIVFDEVARLQFSQNKGTLSLLKDYMESGQFSRGRASYGADTSLVFMGNLEVEGHQPAARYRHLFEVLPRELKETAVLDRLHGFVPGWEFPKLTPLALNPPMALASDYFGEVLLALRDWPYDDVWLTIQKRWPLLPHLNRRDVTALDRIGRGLFKLVFPDGHFDPEVAEELLGLAAECRQRIHEQLMKMEPGEFPPYTVGYEGVPVKGDGRMRVETPLDRQINTAPRPGEATSVVALPDPVTGSISTEVAIVQVVLAGSQKRQPSLLADSGLEGADAVWQVAQFFLGSQSRALGLNTSMHWEGLGVQWTGGPGNLRGHAELSLVMAVVSAWLKKPLPPAAAIIGGLTLSGDVVAPPDIVALTMAALNRGRQIIVLPEGSPLQMLRDTFSDTFGEISWVTVRNAFAALHWAFARH